MSVRASMKEDSAVFVSVREKERGGKWEKVEYQEVTGNVGEPFHFIYESIKTTKVITGNQLPKQHNKRLFILWILTWISI